MRSGGITQTKQNKKGERDYTDEALALHKNQANNEALNSQNSTQNSNPQRSTCQGFSASIY